MIASDFPRLRAAALWLVTLAALGGAALPASAQLGLDLGAGIRPAPVPSRNQPRPADHIVAVINSEPLTNNEVRARLARVEQELAQQGVRAPARAELFQQVLEQLIAERAQLQLARELQLRVDDSMVDAAEENIARQNRIDVAELHRRLSADGISPDTFRRDLRNQLLLTRLRQREVEPRVRVTDVEVEQFIREQQSVADPSAVRLNLGHILVAVPENANPELTRELQAKAEAIRERAQAGEDFATLAREVSDAPGAAETGGSVGLRSADRYPPLFVRATEQLEPGGVSEVVRSGAGFHVIKLLGKRQGALPDSVTQTRVRHILLRPGPQLSEAEARRRLEDYRKRIESGATSFEQLARQHSQDGSAREGGDLGWTNPGSFVPEFEEALTGLSAGQIAGPVQSRFGMHLIQLLDRRQHELSPREQREVARNLLREKKLQEEYGRWAREVRGRAYVELREPPQ